MSTRFTKGQKVKHCLSGAGFTTDEPGVVLKVTKKGVWLDNGPGNDPSGPFDPVTGKMEELMPGWLAFIKEESP